MNELLGPVILGTPLVVVVSAIAAIFKGGFGEGMLRSSENTNNVGINNKFDKNDGSDEDAFLDGRIILDQLRSTEKLQADWRRRTQQQKNEAIMAPVVVV